LLAYYWYNYYCFLQFCTRGKEKSTSIYWWAWIHFPLLLRIR